MHTFIYPSKDTYINNANACRRKNFGIDEILEIYALNYGNKVVYNSPNWHTPPQNSSSYGNEGWLAYDDRYFYVYSGSMWRNFPITNATVPNGVAISSFSGKFSNVIVSPKISLYVSGSATTSTGSFSGSYKFIDATGTDMKVKGKWTTGSFNGRVDVNSTFNKLIVNNKVYTVSPLTQSLLGNGSFKNLVGEVIGASCTGTGPACILNGTFSGSFKGNNFNGYINTVPSSNLYYTDVTNFQGYFNGKYDGSFNPPATSYFMLRPEFSRTLLQFDLTNISSSISNNHISSSNIKFILNLTSCGQRNLPLDYTLYAYPVSQSWDNGDGRWADGGSLMGASWDYRNWDGKNPWYSPIENSYQQINYLSDSSHSTASFKNGGGTWYYNVPNSYTNKKQWICSSSFYTPLRGLSLICSQSYKLAQQGDITMDVTRIVRSWLCGCIPNNGIILASSLEIAVPPIGQTNGLLQFFSKETNTIYSPYLDVAWNDAVYKTGSLSPVIDSTQNIITLQQLKNVYKAGSIPKVFVLARDQYPLKDFSKAYQQPSIITPKYLPKSSYFMIKDAESEEVLIDFDEFSKLSCDSIKGNYFTFDTTGLPQERYFKIFIKAEYPDGSVDIVDTTKVFKIIR